MTNFFANSRRVILVVLAILSLGSIAPAVGAGTPPGTPIPGELESVIPRYQPEFAERSSVFPHYSMDLVLDEANSTLRGSSIVRFTNETGIQQETIPFRLYPNAFYYGEGATIIEQLRIDDVMIDPRFDESGTVLFVDLPTPLAPGETVSIEIDFETVIPRNTSGSFGILNHDLATRRFVLADWYPIVAGWDETGWRLEPPTIQGDPTFAATSIYELRLQIPSTYDVIAPGRTTRLDETTFLIETGPVREFAMVVAADLETQSVTVGETTVSAHVTPDHLDTGQHVLDIAAIALDFYDRVFGPYPLRELEIVETDLSLAYGVSWSGIVFLDDALLNGEPDRQPALDFTLFHELGHQWWGGMIGTDSNDHTFMVEGLTNATALLAQAAIQGPEAAMNSLYAWMVTPYANLLASTGDAVVDRSIFDQPATAPLSTLAYGKGGLGFLAIRDQIGDEAFWRALANYAEQFRLGITEPHDLLDAFETASGQSLQELWTFWFESAKTTPHDLETLIPRIIASFQ